MSAAGERIQLVAPSWGPVLYEQIEERLTCARGGGHACPSTITHIHNSVIPVLAGDGTVFLDGRATRPSMTGAMIAASHGASGKAISAR